MVSRRQTGEGRRAHLARQPVHARDWPVSAQIREYVPAERRHPGGATVSPQEIQRPDHQRRLPAPARGRRPGASAWSRTDRRNDPARSDDDNDAEPADADPPGSSSQTRPQVPGQPGTMQPGAGGGMGIGIGGVVSKSKETSIKIYNGRQKYNEWAFVYTADLSEHRRSLVAFRPRAVFPVCRGKPCPVREAVGARDSFHRAWVRDNFPGSFLRDVAPLGVRGRRCSLASSASRRSVARANPRLAPPASRRLVAPASRSVLVRQVIRRPPCVPGRAAAVHSPQSTVHRDFADCRSWTRRPLAVDRGLWTVDAVDRGPWTTASSSLQRRHRETHGERTEWRRSSEWDARDWSAARSRDRAPDRATATCR